MNDIQSIKQRYGIVGNSEGLNRALDIASQVAATDLSVLVEGENGVGKEAFGRIIHDNSSRKHQKYFAINCGSIAQGTIDSELFGHVKGAFTGAVSDHEGYFAVANKGTLFLDEVGELPLSTQVRLLRVLETGEYIRVGSNEIQKTDVRIVAATNVKMKKAISEGRFREDLYYRLATIPISVPPLRERKEDIPLLFRRFAAQCAEKYRIEPIRLTEDGKKHICNYTFHGNVRQLKNITEQLTIISEKREITKEILMSVGVSDDSEAGAELVHVANDYSRSQHLYEKEREMIMLQIMTLHKEIEELRRIVKGDGSKALPSFVGEDAAIAESEIIVDEQAFLMGEERRKKELFEAYEMFHGKRRDMAKHLGVSERTIYRQMEKYGLR